LETAQEQKKLSFKLIQCYTKLSSSHKLVMQIISA